MLPYDNENHVFHPKETLVASRLPASSCSCFCCCAKPFNIPSGSHALLLIIAKKNPLLSLLPITIDYQLQRDSLTCIAGPHALRLLHMLLQKQICSPHRQ